MFKSNRFFSLDAPGEIYKGGQCERRMSGNKKIHAKMHKKTRRKCPLATLPIAFFARQF